MKDVLMVAHFSELPNGKANGRFGYLANMLSKKNLNVELLTSSYSHTHKKQRRLTDKMKDSVHYDYTMVHEPDYNRNVGLKRIYSHYKFAKNVKKYLNTRKKPDVIYCAVPSLSLAKVVAQYARKEEIEFIIDIQDLWPEAFKMIFKVPLVSDVLFYPLQKQAEYIYGVADKIIAVSETYVNRALLCNNKQKGHSVYLGADLKYFDQLVKENKYSEKPLDEFWIAYIGTLGNSYDLFTIIDALALLKEKGIENIRFIVMGDGPLMYKFKKYARDKKVDAEFLGRLDYSNMVGILSACDIAVNPIRKGSAASIINKVGDYALAGLPVINTQESKEYRELLEKYESGINCENGNSNDVAIGVLKLYRNKSLIKEMSLNSRRLGEDRFNRSQTYQEIANLIE